MREETFNMTQQEMTKPRVIDQTIARSITVKEAARLLNLSERQVLRLKKSVATYASLFDNLAHRLLRLCINSSSHGITPKKTI